MKKNSVHNISKKFRIFYTVAIIILLFFLLLKYINDRMMPSVIKTMEMHGVNKSVLAIDAAVKNTLSHSGIESADLYVRTDSKDGKLTSLSANTMLINSLCAAVSEEISAQMEQLGDEAVYLPLGIIAGLDFLAAKGPEVFEVRVKPVGHCIVDYKTSFKSEGINQVNYQIWLEIKTTVATVNPVISTDFSVTKSMPIVNMYISGEVPESILYPFKIEQ